MLITSVVFPVLLGLTRSEWDRYGALRSRVAKEGAPEHGIPS